MTGPRRLPYRTTALVLLMLLALLGLVVRDEARASWLQARYFTGQSSHLTSALGDGPSDRIRFPGDGPHDRRFGYSRLPAALQAASERDFHIVAQVRVSQRFAELVDRGVSPIFREKTQAGLRILDRRGATLFVSRYPGRIYSSLDSVPPLVWQTLLFLEDRALLDPAFPNHNPSVHWPRMARAGVAWGLSRLGSTRSVPGASTLATQLEKFRHSTEGRTRSRGEKLLQMEAAALRAYLSGENTEAARHRIVVDYLNSVPLAAIAGHGEVTGLGDGLWAWYGADPDEVNRLLACDCAAVTRRAIAYRQVLTLLLAQRRPSYLLLQPDGRDELRTLTDQHLRRIAREGIISTQLRDAALAVDLTLRSRAPDVPRISFMERKGADAVRSELLGVTGVGTLYELDRFDLTVRTTLDLRAQEIVTNVLARLTDPASGVIDRGDPARVIYAVVVRERTQNGNVVRVQVDNFDSPFNVNEGSKLELGSTAKLRTLISYLEIVEQLYLRNAGRPAVNLRAEPVGAGDWITAWTLAYLAANPGVSLDRILAAAMSRPYSASPSDSLTGGDNHLFRNVDSSDDHQILSVRDAFVRSVNLPFIRIMQDIVRYYVYRLPGSVYLLRGQRAATTWDRDNRMADGEEGRELIEHFYQKYADPDSGPVLEAMRRGRSGTQLAWAYRSLTPEAGLAEFGDFLRSPVVTGPPPCPTPGSRSCTTGPTRSDSRFPIGRASPAWTRWSCGWRRTYTAIRGHSSRMCSTPAPPFVRRSMASCFRPRALGRKTGGSARSQRRRLSARSTGRGGAWATRSRRSCPPTRPRLAAPPTGQTISRSWWASCSTMGSVTRSSAWRSSTSPRARLTRRCCVGRHPAANASSRPKSRRSCGPP